MNTLLPYVPIEYPTLDEVIESIPALVEYLNDSAGN
jgi:hypothetical protein